MAAHEPAVSLENVTCQFKRRRALNGLTLQAERGAVLGIVGPNGAGKTTLVDVLCGFVRPNSGRVSMLGLDAARRPHALRRRIGVLPQETALYAEISAAQNLRFAAALYDVPHARDRIAALLRLVGLAERANDVVRTFSGGMQRRLALARALLHDPELLILDEPTVGIDVDARHAIWEHVRGLRAQGRTVLLTTNYLDEAEALCDRVAMLHDGRLLSDDTPAALIARAGRRLELSCAAADEERLAAFLRANPAVRRHERTAAGFVAYVAEQAAAESVVRQALAIVPLERFQTRAPDLAEIFHAIAPDMAA